jgi:hypothetical protein
MTDPVPSKDQVRLAALEHRLLSEEQEARAADIEHKLRFAWAQKKGARLIVDLRDEIERQQAQIATLKGYIERTALAGYRCAECAARLTAEPLVDPLETETRAATSRGAHSTEDAGRSRPSYAPAAHGGRIMTIAECAEAEGGIPFVDMEASTEPLTHQEIFSAVHHHASEIMRLTAAVPAQCSSQPPGAGKA